MSLKTLYQTLEDRGNPDEVISDGPFPCNWPNTWLGDGYYFWDHFLLNAKWWGSHRYQNNCIICKATCEYNTDRCFDLVGTTEHLEQFKDTVDYLRANNLISQNTTVRRILNFLRLTTKSFKYEAIRVYGVNSISPNTEVGKLFANRLFFEIPRPQYLDLTPAIQICLYKKDALDLNNFTIVYPDRYLPKNALI